MLFMDFLNQIGHTLDRDLTLDFFAKLKDYLADPAKVRIVRNYSRTNRATVYTSRDGFRFVGGDNEPAVWCFTEIYDGRAPLHAQTGEWLEKICISHWGARREADESFTYNFKAVQKTWNNGELSPFDHKHIFDVKDDGLSKPPEQMEEAQLRAQMLRLLCPMNHFLFPRYCQTLAEGESPYQAVAAWFMREKYGAEFDNYLKLVECKDPKRLLDKGRENAQSLMLPERETLAAPAVARRIVVPAPRDQASVQVQAHVQPAGNRTVSKLIIDELSLRFNSDPATAAEKKFVLKTDLNDWRFEVEKPTPEKMRQIIQATTPAGLIIENQGLSGRQSGAAQFRTQFGGCYLVNTDAWQTGWNYVG